MASTLPCLRCCSNRTPMSTQDTPLFFRAITAQQLFTFTLEQLETRKHSIRRYPVETTNPYLRGIRVHIPKAKRYCSRYVENGQNRRVLPPNLTPERLYKQKIPTSQPRIAHLSHIPEKYSYNLQMPKRDFASSDSLWCRNKGYPWLCEEEKRGPRCRSTASSANLSITCKKNESKCKIADSPPYHEIISFMIA
ncbi:hypothetical protein GGI42DRAFT_115200 [Trichoderma sp. SZMC 28013]